MTDESAVGPENTALLRVRALAVARGRRAVLTNVDLDVPSGELLFVVGPNGSGKSTLIDACLDLAPLQAGEISYSGRRLASLEHGVRRRFMALVGREESDALGFTVGEILSLASSESSESFGSFDVSRSPFEGSEAWLTEELLGRKLAHLSQGERQRVHLLRGFLQGASVLFLDEATAHLDLAHREEALAAARAYAKLGHAVIVVVHEIELALRHATRVLVLHGGKVVALGSPAECFQRELLGAVFGIRGEVTEHGGQFQLRWER